MTARVKEPEQETSASVAAKAAGGQYGAVEPGRRSRLLGARLVWAPPIQLPRATTQQAQPEQ